ncbi:uncharacterized protein LOC122657298 [Telopea speciosissima]|uniref:uncharacterized protein LOC122657298 n=1 Tax=Telopea speciosissima TaxID=54955 RepID=UPI001CC6DD1C|nr:uncharacterized protein LOC122657298 [Telopea speciosissima]
METSRESRSEMSNEEETNIKESIEQIAKERMDDINDALVSEEAQDLEYEIPSVGKKFDNDEQAYDFYNSYARTHGFSIRRGRSGKTQKGVVWRRIFECSKEGYRKVDKRTLNLRKSRPDKRTGCKARMVVKRMKDGTWSVTEIAYEHNHPLAKVGIINDNDGCVIQEKASTSSRYSDMCHQSVSLATQAANSEKATLFVKTLLREGQKKVEEILKEESGLQPKTSALVHGDPMSQQVSGIQAKNDDGPGSRIVSIVEKKRKSDSQSSNNTQAKKGQNSQSLEGSKQASTQAQSQLNLMSCPLPRSGPIQFQHSFSPLASHHITSSQEMSKEPLNIPPTDAQLLPLVNSNNVQVFHAKFTAKLSQLPEQSQNGKAANDDISTEVMGKDIHDRVHKYGVGVSPGDLEQETIRRAQALRENQDFRSQVAAWEEEKKKNEEKDKKYEEMHKKNAVDIASLQSQVAMLQQLLLGNRQGNNVLQGSNLDNDEAQH